jgi:hypothetical protein
MQVLVNAILLVVLCNVDEEGDQRTGRLVYVCIDCKKSDAKLCEYLMIGICINT